MSKKMMKRSLALGALMAFVITGNALAAEVTINDSSFDGVDGSWNTTDGFYHETELSNNIINIDVREGEFENSIYGAYAKKGTEVTASNNTITISEAINLKGSTVYGAYIYAEEAKASVENNKIEINADITGSGVAFDIIGAFARDNVVVAKNNSVVVNNGEVGCYVQAVDVGGKSITVEDNSVIVRGNSELNQVAQCAKIIGFEGAESVVVKNNTITVEGNAKVNFSTEAVSFYAVSIESIDFDISNNTVNVKDSASVGDVYGVNIEADGLSGEVKISGNTVNLSGNADVSGNVYGAHVGCNALLGGSNAKIGVEGNTVNIGGYVNIPDTSIIYGGYASAMHQETMNASATGNTVIISGNAVVNGTVYGGYAETYSFAVEGMEQVTSSVNASGNEVIISGAANVSNATLAGAKTVEVVVSMNDDDLDMAPTDNSNEYTSQNKFTVSEDWTGDQEVGKTIGNVENFDTITLESAKADEPITIRSLKLKKQNEDGAGGTAIVVEKLQVVGDGAEEGTKIQLFSEDTVITGNLNAEESKATIYIGTSEKGTATFESLDGESGGIEVTVQELDLNPQVLVIGESRAAATAFVNQGSEIVETGLDALARDNSKAGDTKVFAAVYGNASEYATGSHVKVNGWSGIVGIGKTNDNGLTVGAFFENGEGNYRTYNTVNNEFMRGDGEACYNGGGFLVRKDNANGVYTEASLRAGNLQNELRNAVRGSEGLAGYDVDTFYYGAHVGVGKIIPRGNEGDSIDVYGKFIYIYHDSEDFTIDGSDFHFDSVDSERLRLGFRINEVQTNKLSMYYGAAWEYEFNGDADNTTVGYDLATPSLGGSTMIGEIGMHYNASEKWSLDLNVRGYSGQRDGFTGSVQANYAF